LRPRARRIGRSVQGHAIWALHFGRSGPVRLILGGFHGDEPKSVYVTRLLCEHLTADPAGASHRVLIVVPLVNPDGYAVRRRRNANGVDINRNFPTADWAAGNPRSRFYGGSTPSGEPETRAIIRLIESHQPARIITVHSIGDHRQCNNYDGPAEKLARAMAACNGYSVTTSMGYPTPGSFGSWAGLERGIPTVTLELPSHHSPRRCWEDNRAALLVDRTR
jgi:protein MpaA